MAEEIVTCTGCGKKFRIPDGAAKSGSFPCTACATDVVYGNRIAAPSAGGGAKRKSRGGGRSRGGKRSKGRGTGRQEKAAATGGRGGRRGAQEPEEGGGRRGRRGEAARPKKSDNTPAIVAAVLGGLVVLVILVLVLTKGDKPPADSGPTVGDAAATTETHTISTADADPKPETTEPAPPDTETAGTTPDDPAAADDDGPNPWDMEAGEKSGVGSVKPKEDEDPNARKDYSQWTSKLMSQGLSRLDNTPETTDSEREQIDAQVALLVDFQSGKQGSDMLYDLPKHGKKAIPSLLSALCDRTFDNRDDQFAAHQVQLVVRDIVRSDLPPNRDFFARFSPQMSTPKEHFERMARMWHAHWLGTLQYKDSFANFDEEEE